MAGGETKTYRQRRPENTALYRIIQEHLESFLLHAHESMGQRLPRYVENEFRRYLECGLHAHGFALAVCRDCGAELLLPFSCKLRGICPSCNTRRMSNTAAHLVDHVIAPDLTLRQWVFTVPYELRLLLAAKPEALSAIGRVFTQEIQRWQRERARALGFERAEGAAVSFCQRFGSSLNLHVHWHVIVPDALFVPNADSQRVDTVKLRAPSRLDLEEIVTATATRAVRWLERQGYLRDHADGTVPADADSPWLRCLRGSLGTADLQRSAEHGDEQSAARRSPARSGKGLGADYLRTRSSRSLPLALSVSNGKLRPLCRAGCSALRSCCRVSLSKSHLATRWRCPTGSSHRDSPAYRAWTGRPSTAGSTTSTPSSARVAGHACASWK